MCLSPCAGAAARAALADAILSAQKALLTIGGITLRPHQVEAVERLRIIIKKHGGALLADDVGLGKTYVAISLMADWRCPMVVAPANLREMWNAALAACGISAPVVSYESLSRSDPRSRRPDFLVLDESHHARNAAAKRYGRLARLARGARVLLLSATPVHNARRDLAPQFALFLGSTARTFTADQFANCIVMREHRDLPTLRLPAAESPLWLRVKDDSSTLDAILALPPPLPPRDGAEGGALLTWTLVRQWSSSRAALVCALRRRLRRAASIEAALLAGRLPSHAELAAWQGAEDSVQLAFPELISDARIDNPLMLQSVRVHAAAVRTLLHSLRDRFDPDSARSDAILSLRGKHPGARIIVFSQFAETVTGLWSYLRQEPRVAALSARGAVVAGGAISRAEALRRFAPVALGAAKAGPAYEIDLLITTDLLSEGVSLHDASVVVHLDLPWTPARLAQRQGRIRRLGSPHERIWSYAIAPPAAAETMLRVQHRLRGKLAAAASITSAPENLLPGISHSYRASPARCRESTQQRLRLWQNTSGNISQAMRCCAAVRAPQKGWVAAVTTDDSASFLVARVGDEVGEDPCLTSRALSLAEGEDVSPIRLELDAARTQVLAWCESRMAVSAAGARLPMSGDLRQNLLRRLASIMARAPVRRRHQVAKLASRARRIADARLGAGDELELSRLLEAELSDEAWLETLARFAGSVGAEAFSLARDATISIASLIVFTPPA